MPELHPTIVEHNGAPIFVVLPYAEFIALKAAANYSDDAEWDALFNDPHSSVVLDQLYKDAIASGIPQDMTEGFRVRAERRSSNTAAS